MIHLNARALTEHNRVIEYLLILFGIAKYTDNGCGFFFYHSPQNTTPSVPNDYIVKNSSDIQTTSLK